MPDAFRQTAGVAVVPCFDEGRNPIALHSALSSVPGLNAIFIDDASEGTSREALDSLEPHGRVRVVRNARRIGKVASILNVLGSLGPDIEKILLIDCDVTIPGATVPAVLEELGRSDLVLANAMPLEPARTFWEKGAIFSAKRHLRLRDRFVGRYPALCTNGRLLGMSRRLVDAIVSGSVPRHTEDAHFMLVCLERGFRFCFRADARLYYRAPDTLDDYLKQSDRFSEGRALLAERWPKKTLGRYYDLAPQDALSTALSQALRDPFGAAAFVAMLAAKIGRRRERRTQKAAWAVAGSTKVLR